MRGRWRAAIGIIGAIALVTVIFTDGVRETLAPGPPPGGAEQAIHSAAMGQLRHSTRIDLALHGT